MDKCIDIWNVLHDGEITSFSLENGDALTIHVSIPYLRRRMEPPGEGFVLTLSGLKRFEFHNFGDVMIRGGPEILSTYSKAMPVKIETTMGDLILDFKGIQLTLDTGQEIEFECIAEVCEEYWTEWDQLNNNKQSQ